MILARKARRLRRETGDNKWWAPLEKQHKPFLEQAKFILSRPFALLFAEPMLVAITFYMSVRTFPSHIAKTISYFLVVYLRCNLPIIRGVPHRIQRRTRFQQRRLRPDVHPHPRWRPYSLCSIRGIFRPYIPGCSERTSSHYAASGIQVAYDPLWRYSTTYRILLVLLDLVSQCLILGPHDGRVSLGGRHRIGLSGPLQLYY